MTHQATPADLYLEAGSVFHCALRRHFVLWFTGKDLTRHRRTEVVLKRLADKGKFQTIWYEGRLVYWLGRRNTQLIKHGLAATECIVRFARSKEAVAVGERHFKGLGIVPDGGMIYPEGTMLLIEFCTKDNFYYSGNLRGKLSAYSVHLRRIEAKFNCKAIVVFVCDVEREAVKRFVTTYLPDAYFTDYMTFLNVPIGQALTAPIYFWGGKEYPLKWTQD